MHPLDRRYCRIYDTIVNAKCLDTRYCKRYEGILNAKPLDKNIASYLR